MESARTKHLYAKFKSRSSNPDGFDSKLDFWITSINEMCINKRQYCFNLEVLRENFKKNTLVPDLECLTLVTSEMLRRGLLLKSDQFVSFYSKVNQGWLAWSFNVFKSGLSYFKSESSDELVEQIDPSINLKTQFINMKEMEKESNELFHLINQSNLMGKCMKQEAVEKLAYEKLKIDSKYFKYMLLYFLYHKKVILIEEKGLKLIKFGDNPQFNDFDIGLARLEAAKSLVEDDILKVEEEMEKCRREAKAVLKEGNRFKAKALLRRKKRFEEILSKKEGQLDNIMFMFDQMLDVDSHKMIINAYNNCAEVLRLAQSKHADLSSTMANVEEVLEYQSDLSLDLGKNFNTTVIDDDELESELKEMLTDEDDKLNLQPPLTTHDHIKDLEDRLANLRKPVDSGKSLTKARLLDASNF